MGPISSRRTPGWRRGRRPSTTARCGGTTPERNTLRLEVVFTRDAGTPKDQPYQQPDNICVSPYGGLMICEDGDGAQHVLGVTSDGTPFQFARNRQNIGTPEAPGYGEFAGVVFDDRGRTLYLNRYNPGTTFAITGPWRRQNG